MSDSTKGVTTMVEREQNTESAKGLLALVEDIVLSDSEEEEEEVVLPTSDPTTKREDEKHLTSSDYYWNSYAHFGIHEVTS